MISLSNLTEAQRISSSGNYLEGTSYISTTRVKIIDQRSKCVSLSMDYVKLKGTSHSSLNDGEYYTIQLNFYQRNMGEKVLLKKKNGENIELKTKSLQRDPFVQIYWLNEKEVLEIIKGDVTKMRVLTNNGYEDIEINKNNFSNAINKCYTLIKKKQANNKNEEKFRNDKF